MLGILIGMTFNIVDNAVGQMGVVYGLNPVRISWQQAFIRYLSASCLLGLGLLWRIWQKDSKTLHDLSSQSYIIRTDTNVDD
jgi:hypothetical protein